MTDRLFDRIHNIADKWGLFPALMLSLVSAGGVTVLTGILSRWGAGAENPAVIFGSAFVTFLPVLAFAASLKRKTGVSGSGSTPGSGNGQVPGKPEQKEGDSVRIPYRVFDDAPFGVCIIGADGVVEYINFSLHQISGELAERFFSLQSVYAWHEPGFYGLQEAIRSCMRGIPSSSGSVNADAEKDGRDHTVTVSLLPIQHNGTRKSLGVLASARIEVPSINIIDESSLGWRETLDSITDMITIIDTDFNIVYANRSAVETLDLERARGKSAKCYKYHHGMEAPPAGCPSCECMSTRKTVVFELFEPHLDRNIEIRAIPRLDREGRLTGLIHIIRDISDRKDIEMRMNRQIHRLRALRMIDMTISSSLDLRLTLEIFLEQVKSQLNVDAASVMLYDPETQFIKYAADKGFITDRIKKVGMRVGESFAGQVVSRKERLLIPDFSNAESFSSVVDGYTFAESFLVRDERFKAYCGIPLVAKGNINGVLEVFHRTPYSPDAEWMEFLEALAGQAAIAIDNSSLFESLQHSRDELILAYDTTIEGWAMALDLRDRETEGHSRRVSGMTVKIAREIGVPDAELLHIRRGALLHDIGKLGVPDSVLLKEETLTCDEMAIMQSHPRIAYELLSRIPFLRKAIDIPYCHHERWDGSGYPRGLKGEEIPFSARVFAIVDIWDALHSDRPYRRAWGREDVVDHICALAGTHLDPGLVEVFMQVGL